MSAGTHNITIEKGVDFEMTLELKDADGEVINVTGYSFKAEARRKSSTGVAATFTTAITNAATGAVKVSMPASTTRGLPVGKLLYDLVSSYGGVIKRYVTGIITVQDTITDTTSF
ncbi:MAG: hypothetical protein QF535_23990 [Anaerolineales bacterium]|jgi:hypothetical protein|nr:hypothetical protein [Anaerolineales bacterium]|tara:strand:- start:336 stop:680 length:345 start_codon:yes stop_codon:yes gene_type:complete